MKNGKATVPAMRAGLIALAVAAAALTVSAALPDDFPDVFEQLSVLVDQQELSAMDMAHGTYLGTRFFSVGAQGVPYLEQRFLQAKTRGQAAMSGLYLTIWGKREQIVLIRKELETNRPKRVWISELAGTEQRFFSSIEGGEEWRSFLYVLPSVTGPRNLAIWCTYSNDALVRRAGLYWGFWVANPAYWSTVERLAASDPDALTRRIATRLRGMRGKG